MYRASAWPTIEKGKRRETPDFTKDRRQEWSLLLLVKVYGPLLIAVCEWNAKLEALLMTVKMVNNNGIDLIEIMCVQIIWTELITKLFNMTALLARVEIFFHP